MLYYPCIMDRFGEIKQKAGGLMPKEEAEAYLRKYRWHEWTTNRALPQPEITEGLHN